MTHPKQAVYVGLDVHQQETEACGLDAGGAVVWRKRFRTTAAALKKRFGTGGPRTICLEAGSSTPWIHRVLVEFGHDVVIANPRQVQLIAQSRKKTDKRDAEFLARLVRVDRSLLCPVEARSEAAQYGRTVLRARHALVNARTDVINTVRGLLRSWGFRPRSGKTDTFVKRIREIELPAKLAVAIEPLLQAFDALTAQRKHAEATIAECSAAIPIVQHFQAVPGVGPLTSLAFTLCLDDPNRFPRSRDVPAFLGLVPSARNSGTVQRSGRITKTGDTLTRFLLVQAAHQCMQSRSPNALRDWGRRLKARRGHQIAVVALARKLAVVLHTLWRTGETYRPLPVEA